MVFERVTDENPVIQLLMSYSPEENSDDPTNLLW
jgi:hypothetical protein